MVSPRDRVRTGVCSSKGGGGSCWCRSTNCPVAILSRVPCGMLAQIFNAEACLLGVSPAEGETERVAGVSLDVSVERLASSRSRRSVKGCNTAEIAEETGNTMFDASKEAASEGNVRAGANCDVA